LVRFDLDWHLHIPGKVHIFYLGIKLGEVGDMVEDILEPNQKIIDSHHHLWDLRPPYKPAPTKKLLEDPFVATLALTPYYTLDDLSCDVQGSLTNPVSTDNKHRVVGTVFMECGAYYRAGKPEEMGPVGEVEFANGVAAQGASGCYNELRAAAAIIGHADMTLGEDVKPVLDALMAAGNGRLKGIRYQAPWDKDPEVLGPLYFDAKEGLLASDAFRKGFKELAPLGLSFDAWVLEPQLGDVLALAQAFPDTSIILDHCGTPLNVASYKGKLDQNFARWRASIQAIAKCPNVTVKLGGLGMAFCGMPETGPAVGVSSEALAAMWKPYIETCIEAFGPDRAMFESNYPIDRWGANYATIWNTFKRITASYSKEHKDALYAGTAARVYGIEELLVGA